METFEELANFKSLQVLDIRGMSIENNEDLLYQVICDFIVEMPNLRECNLDCCNIDSLEIERLKSTIRSKARSAPKLNNSIDTPKPTQCVIS